MPDDLQVDDDLPDDDLPDVVVYDPAHVRADADVDPDKALRSKRVRRRIQQEVARRHDAERGLAIAQDEVGRLRKELDAMHAASVDVVATTIDGEMSRLESEVAEALEAGDAKRGAEANRKLAEAAAKRQRLEDLRAQRQPPQDQPSPTPQPSPPARMSERSAAWVAENRWFEQDPVMRQAALSIHADLIRRGVKSDSDEYFKGLDRRMRASFPDAFDDGMGEDDGGDDFVVDADPDPEPVPAPARQAVAPASRLPPQEGRSRSKVRLTTEEERFAASLGISVKEYAKRKLICIQQGKIK